VRIKALVFDFDGLIIDSETPVFQTWRETFAKHGRELHVSFWADVIGRPVQHFDLYAYVRENFDATVDADGLRHFHRERITALTVLQPLLPGVLDYLESARRLGLALGVASSSSREHVHGHLQRLGLLDYFKTTKCFEDTGRHKPDPAPYLAVLEELHAAPNEAIAFEDSPNGIASAKAAGIFCVAVPNGITKHLAIGHADYRLNSLADEPLETLLRRFA
jgi:HAD superfamily hydrolase (TIGR01509 family)